MKNFWPRWTKNCVGAWCVGAWRTTMVEVAGDDLVLWSAWHTVWSGFYVAEIVSWYPSFVKDVGCSDAWLLRFLVSYRIWSSRIDLFQCFDGWFGRHFLCWCGVLVCQEKYDSGGPLFRYRRQEHGVYVLNYHQVRCEIMKPSTLPSIFFIESQRGAKTMTVFN
jgi:hypothetical protein